MTNYAHWKLPVYWLRHQGRYLHFLTKGRECRKEKQLDFMEILRLDEYL